MSNGYRGTLKRGKRWEARMASGGRYVYLGTYDTPEDARVAVLEARIERLEARIATYRDEIDALGEELL